MIKIEVFNKVLFIWGMDIHTATAVAAQTFYMGPNHERDVEYITKRWDGRVQLLKACGPGQHQLPTGLFARLIRILGTMGVPHTVVNHIAAWDKDPELAHLGEQTLSVRKYQTAAAMAAIRERPRMGGIMQICTGGGKTRCAAKLTAILKVPTVVLVNQKDLQRQTIEEFENMLGCKVGQIGGGKWDPQPVSVATIQTVAQAAGFVDAGKLTDVDKRMDILNYMAGVKSVILDECFPAGTLIDGIPIEQLKVNDFVRSYNHATASVEYKPVRRLYKSQLKTFLVTLHMSDGTDLVSTADHPIYTRHGGYVPAVEVCSGAELLREVGPYDLRILLERDNFVGSLDSIRRKTCQVAIDGRNAPAKREKSSILLEGLPPTMAVHAPIGNIIKHGSHGLQHSNARKQPYAKSDRTRQNVSHLESTESSADRTRGQRYRFNYATAVIVNCVGWPLGCRVCGIVGASSTGIPNMLQIRSGAPELETECRNRRRNTLRSPKIARSVPRRTIEYVRVDRITVHKQTNIDEPSHMHAGNYVYNIEVSDNNNYFATGVLVHNCHAAPANTAQAAIDTAISTISIVGLSASPWRDDGLDILIEAACGPVVYKISASELIDQGFLVAPVINILHLPVRTHNVKPDEYAKFYAAWVVEDATRNIRVAAIANRHADAGQIVIVLVKQIEHGDRLQALIPDSVFMQGKLSGKRRGEIVRDVKAGHIKVLIATSLADQGLDLPIASVLILAGGGKSSTKALQRIGRVLRPFPGKTQAWVYDLVDKHALFRRHYLERHKIYQLEPRFVIRQEVLT